MNIRLKGFDQCEAQRWDEFVSSETQATFLHSRRFLSYHGQRFTDSSVVIEKDGRYVAVFPAALSPDDRRTIISHPGITYGGLLWNRRLRADAIMEILIEILGYYKEQGYTKLVYKAIPHIYHVLPSQDDLYSLYRLEANRVRCDLSSVINLRFRPPLSERRKRSLKKAQKAGIRVSCGAENLERLWPVVIDNLRDRHCASPTHSLDEIKEIADLFPAQVKIVCAVLEQEIVAGVVIFVASNVWHLQYSCSTNAGRMVCAIDFLVDYTISESMKAGIQWFDFGISTERQGRHLNADLYRFKSEFGGGGVVYETYELFL